MSTKAEVAGYLHDLAWKRYRVELAEQDALPVDAPDRLSAAQVRAAVAAMDMRLRWIGKDPQTTN
jgi:hypothetical protein